MGGKGGEINFKKRVMRLVCSPVSSQPESRHPVLHSLDMLDEAVQTKPILHGLPMQS